MTVFTRESLATGKTNSMDLPITDAEYQAYKDSGKYIQDALPQLNADQREFLISGCTPAEWEDLFGFEDIR